MTEQPPIIQMIKTNSWMDADTFTRFISNLPDTLFGDMTKKDASYVYLLEKQNLKPEDGYPVHTDERLFTWAVNDLIAEELEYLQDELYDLGIDEVKIGTEIEFSTAKMPLPAFENTTWLAKKELFLEQLTQEIEKTNNPKSRTLLEEKKTAGPS